MKTHKLSMGFLFLSAIFLGISNNINSQDFKISRQEQKEAKKAARYANFQILDTLLARKNFVLEAEYLENQYGHRVNATPILNFIRVDSTSVVLQTGENSSSMGLNGVGGVTAEGKVHNWRINKNYKNLSFFLRFGVITDIGVFDVSMSVNADNNVQATISGLTPGKLIYIGHLVSLNNSAVYKGHNIY